MNPYDQAHELARALKQSEEYLEMNRLEKIAREDATNRTLLDEFEKLTYRMQTKAAVGEALPEDDRKRFEQIGMLLQFNADVSAYMLAKLRYQRLLSDIFKILADTAGVDLDSLMQG
jgi:Uncharacterized conserved protein